MRTSIRIVIVSALSFAASCDSADDPMSRWRVGGGPLAVVSGRAFVFGPTNGETLDGATVSVAEAPEYQTTVAADGTFSFEVPSGAPVSLLLQHPGFHDNQTATIPLGPEGLAMVGFQAPIESVFGLLALLVNIEPDPARCQISTTVSRLGTAPYGGAALGEPGVVVTIDPPLPPESGPFYFEYVSDTYIYPEPALTATSIDGGVIFANVPPGKYTLSATKDGKRFTPVAIRCRAGRLVNAAPPYGLQEY